MRGGFMAHTPRNVRHSQACGSQTTPAPSTNHTRRNSVEVDNPAAAATAGRAGVAALVTLAALVAALVSSLATMPAAALALAAGRAWLIGRTRNTPRSLRRSHARNARRNVAAEAGRLDTATEGLAACGNPETNAGSTGHATTGETRPQK